MYSAVPKSAAPLVMNYSREGALRRAEEQLLEIEKISAGKSTELHRVKDQLLAREVPPHELAGDGAEHSAARAKRPRRDHPPRPEPPPRARATAAPGGLHRAHAPLARAPRSALAPVRRRPVRPRRRGVRSPASPPAVRRRRLRTARPVSHLAGMQRLPRDGLPAVAGLDARARAHEPADDRPEQPRHEAHARRDGDPRPTADVHQLPRTGRRRGRRGGHPPLAEQSSGRGHRVRRLPSAPRRRAARRRRARERVPIASPPLGHVLRRARPRPSATPIHKSDKTVLWQEPDRLCATCHNVNYDRNGDGRIAKGVDLVLQTTFDE